MTQIKPEAAAPAVQLPRSGLWAFSGGSIGMGVWVTVPGLLALYFLTDILGVSPLIAGFALLIPKIGDVILHPFVGHFSDVQRVKRGHRLVSMAIACALPLAFAAMFIVPGGITGTPAAIWVGVAFLLGNLLFAAYQVPYLATPADLAIGYHERTRLMSFRMVVLTVGILLSGVAAPALSGGDNKTRGGYVLMASVLAVAMLAAMIVGIGGVRRLTNVAGTPAPTAAPKLHSLFVLLSSLKDKQFRPLAAAYLVVSAASHLVLAGVPYFAEYELGRPELTVILMAAFLAPALFATPGWLWLSRRIGKQRGLLIAQAVFALGSFVLALGASVPLVVLVVDVAILGISFAALQLLAFSMLPDVVNAARGAQEHRSEPASEEQTGPRQHDTAGARENADAGNYTGVWTAADSAGGALGPYLYAAALAIGGFVASTGEPVAQSESALAAVRLGFGIIPGVLLILAFLLQRRYTLDRHNAAA